jgi:predicted nucleic acid-binding protein
MAPVTTIVLLDAGPLGFAVHPNPPAGFKEWLDATIRGPLGVVVPEITDFEVRRSLLRIRSRASIERLDRLTTTVIYAPITTPIMRRAAQLWAEARQQGRPTAPNTALDADVILAATALEIAAAGEEPLVITTNSEHLARYTPAATWQNSDLS